MTASTTYLPLSNGNKIPAIGVGSGFATRDAKGEKVFDPKLVDNLVKLIELPGYQHVDTAQVYRVYPEIADALTKISKTKEQYWITDKWWPGRHLPGHAEYSLAFQPTPAEGLQSTLDLLNIPYVDLYLLHIPDVRKERNGFDLVQAWKYFEEILKSGKAKNIGISNFHVDELELLLANAEIKPVVHQLEHHPYYQQSDVVALSKKNGILIEGYSPLAPITKFPEGPITPIIKKLAAKYNKSDSQILLRWNFQNDVVNITYSSKFERVLDLLDIFDFELTKEEVEEIKNVGATVNFVKWVQSS